MDREFVTSAIIDSLRMIGGGSVHGPFPGPNSPAELFPDLPSVGDVLDPALFDPLSPTYIEKIDHNRRNYGVSPWPADSLDTSTIDRPTFNTTAPYYFQSRVYKVLDEFRFLDEVNEFPTLCLTPSFEQFHHSLTDQRYSRLGFDLRAYLFFDISANAQQLSDMGSDGDEGVIEQTEALADDIEHVLMNLHKPIPQEAIDALRDLEYIQTQPYFSVVGDEVVGGVKSYLHLPDPSLAKDSRRDYIQDLRIHSIEIDEGLNHPFSVLLMNFSVLYLH